MTNALVHEPSGATTARLAIAAHNLPGWWYEQPPPKSLASHGLKTVAVPVPFMRLGRDGDDVLLSTWEVVRALYAWTTTLSHALVSGVTGSSLVDRLAWYPPSLLGGPRPAWPEELGPRHYRVRLRLDSDQERATAAQVVLHALDPRVRAATDRLRLSLSTPLKAGVRWPDTSLPVAGAVEIQFLPGPHPEIPLAGALVGLRWSPPFDRIEFVIPGSKIVGPANGVPRQPTTSTTVQSLDDRVERREDSKGRRVTVRAPIPSISDRFVARVERVPKSTTNAAHRTVNYRTSPVGSVGAGGTQGKGAVSRGVTTQAPAQAGNQLPPGSGAAPDLACIAVYLAEDLEADRGKRDLPWGAVGVRLRHTELVAKLANPADLASADVAGTIGKRHLTSVEIGIDEWGVVAIDLERFGDDSSRDLHAVGLVRSPSKGPLPGSAELAKSLLATGGCIPRSDGLHAGGLVWHAVRHPLAVADAVERQTALRRILVRHVRRIWADDHTRRP